MKKQLITTLLLSSLAFADYYSVSNANLDENKVLHYGDGITITVKNQQLRLDAGQDLNWLEVNDKEKVLDEGLSIATLLKQKDIKVNSSLSSYNFNYLLSKHPKDKRFWLVTKDKYMLVKSSHDKKSFFHHLLGRDVAVIRYEYEVEDAYDKKGKKVKIPEDEILTTYIDTSGGILGLELLDKGVKKLVKIEDKHLKTFLTKRKTLQLEVKNFDFKNQSLYLSYLSKTSSSQKRLNITYSTSKNKIKTVLESPISLFDPENNSRAVEQNVGILYNYKNKKLFEIKKVQIIDGNIDVTWVNLPKKKVVVVSFMNDGEKDKKVLSKSKGQQFYSIEGVFYLVSWMQQHAKSKQIFTFMNGSLPFDVTMTKAKKGHFEMKKSGNVIYTFDVDAKGFVTAMQYPSYDVSLTLDRVQNDTTRKNNIFLEDFQSAHNIVLIKE